MKNQVPSAVVALVFAVQVPSIGAAGPATAEGSGGAGPTHVDVAKSGNHDAEIGRAHV